MKTAVLPILFRTFAAVTFAGLLSAQVQFTVNPNPIVFASVPAATQQSQTVSVTSNVPSPISVQVPSYFQPFLSVSSVPAATTGNPATAQFVVTVDTHGLAASTVPNQFLLVLGVTGSTNQIQIPVNVTVTGAAPSLAATPTSVTFSYQTGGGNPAAQSVTLTSTTGFVQTFSVTTTSAGWLSATPTSGNTSNSNSLSIAVNPTGLAVGGYDGTVAVTPTGGNPLNIPIHIDVTAPPQVTLSKTALSFVWQTTTGLQGLPGSQTLTLESSVANSRLFFNVTPSATLPDPAWLVVTPTSGFTSADLQVGLNTQVVSSMLPGKHTAIIYVDAPGTTPSRQTIQVTFTISSSPLLTIAPASLTYNMAATGALPAAQTITVNSTSSATPITATFAPSSGSPWAAVAVTSTTTPASTPAQVQVSILPFAQSLPAQTYTGTVTITSANDQQSIPVTLTVSNVPVLNISPAVLTYSYQIGRSLPADQSLQISSSGAPISLTAAASSTGNWLVLNTASTTTLSTPTSLIVSIDRTVLATLAPNTYTGSVVLTQSTGQVVTILVTLNVSQTALFQVSPAQLEFVIQPSDARIQRKDISVSSTGDAFTFSPISAGGFWLSTLGASVQTTSANVTIQVDATLLTPGIYTGVVTFIALPTVPATTNPAVSVPIKITVASGAIVTDKNGLSFTQVAGGSLPASQTLNVTNSAGNAMTFSATAQMDNGGNWLSVTPLSGTTPQQLTVSVANTAGLAAGTTYTGAVIIQAPGASNSPQAIRVAFTVVPPQTITVPVTPLSFTSTSGATPATQSVAISSSGIGQTFTATATTASGGAWLVATPASGSLPTLLNVSIAPAVLATLSAGTYSGSIRIDSPNATNTPQTIPVSLVVTSIAPVVSTVKNSASYQPGAVAPGEILYIEGSAMGPSTLTVANPNPTWATTLSGVQVTFDGIQAPILYAMNNKLSVVVPWAVSGRLSTRLIVSYQSQSSTPLDLQVTSVAPGLYTADASGTGQAAILNYHPNGQVDINSSNRPIERGGAISVYGTGGGVTTPFGVDGAVTPAILYPLNARVTAFIGGQSVPVLYSGGAPGLLSGAMQINVSIPQNAPTGSQPLVVLINGVPTQANALVNIR